MTDYSANGHYEYGVFFKGGVVPWAAALTEADAREIVIALKSVENEDYEVRPL